MTSDAQPVELIAEGDTFASLPAAGAPRRGATAARAWVVATQVALLAALIGLWQLAASSGWIDRFLWSSPREVVHQARIVVTNGTLLTSTAATLHAAILGFAIGTAGGAVIGLLLWWSRFAARVVEPLIVAFHAIPKLALAPLFILVLGLGIASKVAVVVAATVVTSALVAHAGVKAVDGDLISMLVSLGARRGQVFRKVVVPSTAPWIVSALRLNIGLSLTAAVIGEMLGSRAGLGRMIVDASGQYDVGLVWVGVLTVALLGIAMYVAVGFLERILLRGVLHTDGPERGW